MAEYPSALPLQSSGFFNVNCELHRARDRYDHAENLATDYETGIYSAAKQIVIFLPHIAVAFSMGIIPGIAIFDETAAPIRRQLYYRCWPVSQDYTWSSAWAL